MSRQGEAIKSWLALESWRWGHSQGGEKGSIMVACCLANRVKHGWGTYSQILNSIPLHSSLNLSDQPTGYPDSYDPIFIKLSVAVDKIYSGEAEDLSNGGLYFADLANITRPWFLESIVRNPAEHPSTANLKTLTFFK